MIIMIIIIMIINMIMIIYWSYCGLKNVILV